MAERGALGSLGRISVAPQCPKERSRAGGSIGIAGRWGLGRGAQAACPWCGSAWQTLGFPELLGAVPEPLKSGSRGQEGEVGRTGLGPAGKDTLRPPLGHPADTTGPHVLRPHGPFIDSNPATRLSGRASVFVFSHSGVTRTWAGGGQAAQHAGSFPGCPSAWKAVLGSGSCCYMSLWFRHLLTSDLRAEEQW